MREEAHYHSVCMKKNSVEAVFSTWTLRALSSQGVQPSCIQKSTMSRFHLSCKMLLTKKRQRCGE